MVLGLAFSTVMVIAQMLLAAAIFITGEFWLSSTDIWVFTWGPGAALPLVSAEALGVERGILVILIPIAWALVRYALARGLLTLAVWRAKVL